MSDQPSINQDIKKINISLEQGDDGFLLSFPVPPSGSVKPRELYSFNFDSPIGGRLPQNPRTNIIFTPSKQNNNEEASFLSSSINTSINIGLSIKAKHKAETQTLIRLQIKDIYNIVLYTDYILVVCSPKKTIRLNASLVRTNEPGSLGPNGGRILRINTLDASSDLVSSLFSKMLVTGPGLPEDKSITIASFLNRGRTELELLPYFDSTRDVNTSYDNTATYSFTNTFSCPSQQDLEEISLVTPYVLLDKANNWSYFFRQKPVIQFVPNRDPELSNEWENIAILLNVKNFEAIIPEDQPASIPATASIVAGGRVINDSVCINSI